MRTRTGTAQLPLHGGKAPAWLFSRMVKLAREISIHVASEFGPEEMLRRLSDPFWFQAFGCVLGFDWHSSGVTTTVTGALKEGIRGLESELGLYAGGGKGAASRNTPSEITTACERLSLDPRPLVYASRMSAKVDSAAVQDGYQLYHHAFFFTPSGGWCVVQQGMNDDNGMARRYHWLSTVVKSYVEEPHAAVCADTKVPTLNLVATESEPVRSASAELARQKPSVVLSAIKHMPVLTMPRRHAVLRADVNPQYLQKILLKTYDRAPENFETLLGMEGVGASTLRALALVSEIIYGTPASTRDPARFSFAHGGKDGFPYPVDTGNYDRTIEVLRSAVTRAGIDRSERVQALKRLVRFGEERVRARMAETPRSAGRRLMRGWLLLLCVFLFVWEPLKLASQLAAAIGTLPMRGPYAVGELLAHAVVAALTVGAGWALWVRNPHAPGFATIALVASAAAVVQSCYWSLLPSNTMPGDRLPLSLAAIAHAAGWIAYLRRSRRVRALYD